MYDGPDNNDRADWADDALTAMIAAAQRRTWPLADAERADAYNEFARAALHSFAVDTRHYPVTCFDDPTPRDADDRAEAAEIMGDFLGNLRHLLDRYDLTVDAIHAAPPAPDAPQATADVHLMAMLARACVWQYATAAGFDFDELDERGAYYHREEVAEAAVYVPAELEPIPASPQLLPTPVGRLVFLRDLYLWTVLRLVRTLRKLTRTR
ncbi:MAG: hypothetical protein HOV96_19415 [Nonomuraea sp.]|nr:hypothetical protein [Nonomuraea sp.]NUR59336.1 hypothetical protein [Catenulispora sp.]